MKKKDKGISLTAEIGGEKKYNKQEEQQLMMSTPLRE